MLEIGFQQAIEKAKSLDYQRALKQPVGPLHGLPITVKDQFYVKGMETSMAYVGWIDTFEGDRSSPRKDNVESEIIRELESLGAIVIAKVSSLLNNRSVNVRRLNRKIVNACSNIRGGASVYTRNA